jgi:hypothetical protein
LFGRNTQKKTLQEEERSVADERINSVAVPRKKKTAVDAFRNIAQSKFG